MALFRNLPVIALVSGLGIAAVSAANDESAKDSATNGATSVPAVPADAKKAGATKEKDRLDLPVPPGQPQKGLRIPIFNPDGKLMMSFQIGVAEVVDADHIKMGDLRLETFKETGE